MGADFDDFGDPQFVRRMARIAEVKFGIEDHGMYGFHIGFDHGSMRSGTGWLTWSARDVRDDGILIARGEQLGLMYELMEALGVREWADLKGRVVWALFDKEHPSASPVRGVMQLEIDGHGAIVWETVLGIFQGLHKDREIRRRKIVNRDDLEVVIAGAEAMLLQGADTEISREWAEEIVADVLKLADAEVES